MKLRFYHRLMFKVHTLIMLLMIPALGLVMHFFFTHQKELQLAEIRTRVQTLSKTLALHSAYGVLTEDFSDLKNWAEALLSLDDVAFVLWENDRNRLLFCRHKSSFQAGLPLKKNETLPAFLYQNDGILQVTGMEEVFHAKHAIFLQEEKKSAVIPGLPFSKGQALLGYAHIGLSLKRYQQTITSLKKQILGVSVVLIFLGYALVILLSRFFLKPIHDLVKSTQRIAEGDFHFQVLASSKSELGLLTEAFNQMTQQLRLRQAEKESAQEAKRSLEKQVQAAEKLSTLGTLSGGLAHEFNNVLAAIKTEAQAAQHFHYPDYTKESLKNIVESSELGAVITNNLLNFAKPIPPEHQKTNLPMVIEKALSLVRQSFKNLGIQIVCEGLLDESLSMDPIQMQQVFLNFLTNARDAMRQGGKLIIRTQKTDSSVRISFKDTGIGIPKETLSRIFEPFFSTKGIHGKSEIPGTGLGLSVALGIVKQHGGEILVESVEEQGSVFTVQLPLSC